MHQVTTVRALEALVGTPVQMVRLKEVRTLDDGCRSVLAGSPIAGFGFRDRDGTPHSTLVGGTRGFARVESPTRFGIDLPQDHAQPVDGDGVSFVFLLPGIGETLRVNGRVAQRSPAGLAVDVEAAYVHCARCILRSGLWKEQPGRASSVTGRARTADGAARGGHDVGPLADGTVTDFTAAAPFLVVSSWDSTGASDTSPRGDAPGFVRIIDERTLVVPDRRGNHRADTFHNVLSCDQLSLAVLVPGRTDVLHLSGTASVTDDQALLAPVSVGDHPPQVGLVVSVEHAEITANDALAASGMWDPSARVDRSSGPDMNRIALQHLAGNGEAGVTASMTRTLGKGLAAAPTTLLRRAMDAGYRRELQDEGY